MINAANLFLRIKNSRPLRRRARAVKKLNRGDSKIPPHNQPGQRVGLADVVRDLIRQLVDITLLVGEVQNQLHLWEKQAIFSTG